MTLAVHRLATRLRCAVPPPPERVQAWQDAFAALDGDAIGPPLDADEWLLIRRLALRTRWSSDEVASDAARLWGGALQHAIDATLAHRDDRVWVRYPSRRAAVADMLYRSALGETARQWAWRRMGLIARAPLSGAAALDAAHALLMREPELIWPAVQRIVEGERDAASLSALLRAWPAAVWASLLERCPRTAVYARALREASQGTGRVADQATSDLLAVPVAEADAGAAAPLLAWAAARPQLARTHADTLAVLIAAAQWPGAGESGTVPRRRVRQWRERLFAAAEAAAPGRPVPARVGPPVAASGASAAESAAARTAAVASAQVESTGPGEARRADAGPLPELPAPELWRATRHGGALFWLPRLADAAGELGLEEAAGERPTDALRLRLAAVARALGVPRDDAAFDAFCGGEAPAADPPPAFAARAQALVDGWQDWLAAAAPELAPPRLATVCRREGRLRFEPGWIELRLPLAGVDTAVRRLGLDLDPGWLPWLGCVVRIAYGE